MLFIEVSQPLVRNMRVNLGCRYITMSEQHLYNAQVSPMIQQMGGKGMAQGMGRKVFGDAGGTRM